MEKLLRRMGDSNFPVIAGALATLRNLVLTQDPRVVDTLATPDSLGSFLHPLRKANELLSNQSERDTAIKIIYHTIGLFWNLRYA